MIVTQAPPRRRWRTAAFVLLAFTPAIAFAALRGHGHHHGHHHGGHGECPHMRRG